MRIILDGNDGVGKTNLAKRLQQDLDIKSYIHLSYNDPKSFTFYNELLKKSDVIFDRSFIDERIYSEVFKRRCSLSFELESYLYNTLKLLNYKVIICHTETKQNKDNEDAEIIEHEMYIDSYFKEIAKAHNFIYYDPFNDSYDDLLKKMLS